MGTPVSREVVPNAALRNLTKPFGSVIENQAAEGIALALIPREEIEAIRPQYPIWLFPPDLAHTGEATVDDAFNPGYLRGGAGVVEQSPHIQRTLQTDPTRGRGRVAHRPSTGEINGAPRNVSGPVYP